MDSNIIQSLLTFLAGAGLGQLTTHATKLKELFTGGKAGAAGGGGMPKRPMPAELAAMMQGGQGSAASPTAGGPSGAGGVNLAALAELLASRGGVNAA